MSFVAAAVYVTMTRWGWGTSDPFLTILRAGEFGQWRVVHRTEVGPSARTMGSR